MFSIVVGMNGLLDEEILVDGRGIELGFQLPLWKVMFYFYLGRGGIRVFIGVFGHGKLLTIVV